MPKPRIAIVYCTQCNWLLRTSWMAQEILATFADQVSEVALVPASGGAFASRSAARSSGTAPATAAFRTSGR